MPIYRYSGPQTRATRPKSEELLVLIPGKEYDLAEDEFPGLMSRHRSPKSGKLSLVNPQPAAKAALPRRVARGKANTPKADASSESGGDN